MTPSPAIIVGNGMLQGSVEASEEWRKHGEARRRQLLEKDEMEGGTSFSINRKCSIQRYFQIGDRVLSQFRAMYNIRSNLEEIYTMGYRLIAFYTEALPNHPEYRSIDPSVSYLREKSINDLDWIQKRLDVIALRIDEEQLNRFILDELEKEKEENAESGHDSGVDGQWESFSGWSTEVARNQARHSGRASRVTPTELSFASDKVEVSPISSSKSIDMSSMDSPKSVELLPSEWVDDPGYILDLESDDDTDAESDSDFESEQAVQYEFAEESEYDSSFLRVIANEEVHYETDSDAVDSWAQDDDDDSYADPHALSYISTPDTSMEETDGTLAKMLHKLQIELPTSRSTGEAVFEAEKANSSRIQAQDAVPSLQNFPSFDEPDDDCKSASAVASPQDVMSFDNLEVSSRRSSSYNKEESMQIYLPGLRV